MSEVVLTKIENDSSIEITRWKLLNFFLFKMVTCIHCGTEIVCLRGGCYCPVCSEPKVIKELTEKCRKMEERKCVLT